MSVAQCRIIELPKIVEDSGSLTFVEQLDHIPFEIKRIYYVCELNPGATRGGHAHKTLHEFVIALQGSFDVQIDDGRERRTFRLEANHYGLYTPPMTWREFENFSPGAMYLTLASENYEAAGYHRDYQEFLACRR